VIEQKRISGHLLIEQRRDDEFAQMKKTQTHCVVAERDERRIRVLMREHKANYESVCEQRAAPIDAEIH
jgi:hypothetical protein